MAALPRSRRGPAPVRTALLALGLAGAAVAGTAAPGPAAAEPRPSIAEVERRVSALDVQAEKALEDYEEMRLSLAGARRQAATAAAKVAREEKALGAVRAEVAAVVAAAYRRGGQDPLVTLVAARTPQAFLDRAASLDRVARSQADRMAAVATARHRLAGVQRTAAQELEAQQALERRVAAAKSRVEDALRTQRRLLSSLRADERRRFEAARAARAAEARRLALRASRDRSEPTYDGPASGRAGVAVAEAYRKLGSPYQWAASGPDRFDCSGLTMWVWGKAGVSLPHSSRAQYASGRKVSRSEIQPGDLVYFGSPIHHVGIYIGGGRMISAPRTGDVVKIQNAFRSDYVGATRP